MQEMEEKLAGIDVYVSPAYGGSNLLLTNPDGASGGGLAERLPGEMGIDEL